MANARKKEFVPQVLTANRLRDGDVVYWSDEMGWVEDLSLATVFNNEQELHNAEDHGRRGSKSGLILDAYLFQVEKVDGDIRPTQTREVIRAKGPTVRLDLGKQAQSGAPS